MQCPIQLSAEVPTAAIGTHPHPALLGSLLELDAHLVEPLTRRLEVIHTDADVAEPAVRLLVPGLVLEVRVILWVEAQPKNNPRFI